MPESDWSAREFDSEGYAVHVEAVLDHQEVHETSANPHRVVREFRAGAGEAGKTRYLILVAELNERVGRFLTQPWFGAADRLLQADLCSDWVEPIGFIIENDGLDGEAVRFAPVTESPDNDNVIEFPLHPLDEEVGSKI